VRIGIAMGLVVVGDLIGEGAAQERGVVGETPHLAARLQALAAPSSLVAADATRRQVASLFEFEDLGKQQLAGFAEPQHAWRIVSESGVVSRFEALRTHFPVSWSAAKRRSKSCCGAGRAPGPATARSCCCRVRRALASRAWSKPSRSGSSIRRAHISAGSARCTIRIARFTADRGSRT
jgi:hypothetical protein